MKKQMKLILTVLSAFLIITGLTSCNKDKSKNQKYIAAIFSGIDKQPFSDSEDSLIDTLWIYYSDNTFDQYAEIEKEEVLFSQGTYTFKNDGRFLPEPAPSVSIEIEINRTKKYQKGKGLTDYRSSHIYNLYSLGFKQLWCANKS